MVFRLRSIKITKYVLFLTLYILGPAFFLRLRKLRFPRDNNLASFPVIFDRKS